jgi:hypothetical protein
MPGRKTIADLGVEVGAREPPPGRLIIPGLIAAVAGAIALLALVYLPGALALPTAGAVLLMAGFALAAGAYLSGARMSDRGPMVGSYEIAGALVFLGFSAAMLSDSEQALALLEQVEMRGLAALEN